MTCCVGPIAGDIAHKTAAGQDQILAEELKHGAKHLGDGSLLYTLSVPGIHCGQCISTIESKLSKLASVKSVRANLSLRRVTFGLSSEAQSPLLVVNALEELGYASQSLDDEWANPIDTEFRLLVRSLAVAGFATANIMLLSVSVWSGASGATAQLFHFLSALIAIPTVAYAGRPFFRSAMSALSHRRMNMDVPISLGVILATCMSLYESFSSTGHAYFDAAVSLLFFLLIGRTLDYLMRTKARDAVSRLSRLAAKGGLVVNASGETNYLPLNGIKPGMIVRVAAGERIPVDGTIVDGISDVDRSLVTGESEPVRLTKSASIEAGTLNLTGALDLRVDRDASQSFLSEVLEMMQAAEQGRGTYLRLADRMAKMYSPLVHLLAFTTLVGWLIYTGGNWHVSITTAISVLIITCPCALGLAVPVAHVLAASRLFTVGVLMKDGSALERLGEINHVAFDKTGTLTTNMPRLSLNTIPRGPFSAMAKALALRSIHPAARALAKALDEKPITTITAIHEVPGHGVEGRFEGRLARLGRMEWVSEISHPAQPGTIVSGLAFAVEGSPIFRVELDETLRPS
ncbi:MAG: heavy metal translocating P-type ATPase, partial [Alphaproteobacteria bacterium]|nr:heavy metal translocating P-type ATPase [Alphaproteobacteria bacterium]